MFDPESTEVALLALVTAALSAVPFARPPSRSPHIFGQVNVADQPCVFLIPAPDSLDVKQPSVHGQSVFQLNYMLLVYARADAVSQDGAPQTLLNGILKKVVGALRTSPAGLPQTLGGLVDNVWVNGKCMMDTGILDQQCFLMIPITAVTGD